MLLLRELATKLSCLLCFRRESGQCVGKLWEEHVRAASRFRTPRLSRRRWVGSPATELGEGLHREGGTLFHRSQLRYLNNNHIHCVVCDCRGDYNPGWSEGDCDCEYDQELPPTQLSFFYPGPAPPPSMHYNVQCTRVHQFTTEYYIQRHIMYKDTVQHLAVQIEVLCWWGQRTGWPDFQLLSVFPDPRSLAVPRWPSKAVHLQSPMCLQQSTHNTRLMYTDCTETRANFYPMGCNALSNTKTPMLGRHKILKYNLLWNSYNINIILEWESSAKFPSINFSRCTKLHHPLISNWLFVPLHFLINAFNNLDSEQYLILL